GQTHARARDLDGFLIEIDDKVPRCDDRLGVAFRASYDGLDARNKFVLVEGLSDRKTDGGQPLIRNWTWRVLPPVNVNPRKLKVTGLRRDAVRDGFLEDLLFRRMHHGLFTWVCTVQRSRARQAPKTPEDRCRRPARARHSHAPKTFRYSCDHCSHGRVSCA